MLGEDRAKWEADDVYAVTKKKLERIKTNVRIQIACGTKDDGHIHTVRDYHEHLKQFGVDHTYIEIEGLMHQPKEMIARLKPIWFDYHVESMRLGQHVVTQGQWEGVMGTRPWSGEDYVKEHSDYPAVCVSWEDTQEFIGKLNAVRELYRLPSEAEWEYGCRAGTSSRWSFGDGERVNEWCGDWYEAYASRSQVDPVGPICLYNLKEDPGQKRNVARKHPEVVKRLEAAAERMRADLGDGAQAGTGRRFE